MKDTIKDTTQIFTSLDRTCMSLEDCFTVLLNDPDCYCEAIYTFFNFHELFQFMPVTEHFLIVNSFKHIGLDAQNSLFVSQKDTITVSNDEENINKSASALTKKMSHSLK